MMRPTAVLGTMLLCLGVPPLFVLANTVADYSATPPTRTLTTSAGQTREYILYVPKSYDRAKPAPLVISIHGAMNWPSFQMALSQWNRLADEQGFIVVYPAGTGGGPKVWHMNGLETKGRLAPDIVFISELIDTIAATYTIDRARVYANGLSNGGGMTYALSCTLPDTIAAFGPVASAITMAPDFCPEAPPAPAIVFHGTADPLTVYGGSKVWIAPDQFPNIENWVAAWARRNRCSPAPVESAVAPDVTRREYTQCADEASVQFYTVKGAGHQWFGGPKVPEWILGPQSTSIDATRVMWSFFQEHPLRRRTTRQ